MDTIDRADFEQGKAARAQDDIGMAKDRVANRAGRSFDRAADCHYLAVNVLLCRAGRKIDTSGSTARRAYYGAR